MATPALAFAQIANECEAEGMTPKNAEHVGSELAKTFMVHPDEVGIMKVEGANLVFVYPARFHNMGSIPMNTTGAVAAVCASTKRAQVINNFAQHKHVSIFESIDLSGQGHVVGVKHEVHSIQKLICAPVVGTNGSVGVIEICRKGTSAPASGPDFTPADLQRLVTIAGTLARCFK